MNPGRTGVGAIAFGTGLIALALTRALFSAVSWTAWAMIGGCAILITGCVLLGAARSKMRTLLAWSIAAFLLGDLLAGFGLPLLLPAESVAGPYWLGLPVRVAIEVYGVGLLPLVVLPVVFALTFRSRGLDSASIDELRRRCATLRRADAPLGGPE